jgi:hypothetical protein
MCSKPGQPGFYDLANLIMADVVQESTSILGRLRYDDPHGVTMAHPTSIQ